MVTPPPHGNEHLTMHSLASYALVSTLYTDLGSDLWLALVDVFARWQLWLQRPGVADPWSDSGEPYP